MILLSYFINLDLNLVSQPNNCIKCVNEYLDWTGCLPNDDTSCILNIVWVAAPWLSTAYQCPPVTCQGVEVSKSDIRWRSMTKHANVSRLTFIRYSGLFIHCLFTDIFIILDVRTFAIFWRIFLFGLLLTFQAHSRNAQQHDYNKSIILKSLTIFATRYIKVQKQTFQFVLLTGLRVVLYF